MRSKPEIDQVLRQKTDAQEVPGVVAMAATNPPIKMKPTRPTKLPIGMS